MNKVFNITKFFRVPDETLVSPFLNSKDCMSGLPFDLLSGVSISAGQIEANCQSKIHVMPYVTQITFVRNGNLAVMMKGSNDHEAYRVDVIAGQALITEPGVFLQFINETDQPCEVLYIVSPPYLFDKADTESYDDSFVLDESWTELKDAGWRTKTNFKTLEERQVVETRMEEKAQLIALENVRINMLPFNFTSIEQYMSFLDDFRKIYSPLEDGSLDPGDSDNIESLLWQKLGKHDIQATRKEMEILVRLAPLFKKLCDVSDAEFEEFVKYRFHARMQSKVIVQLLQMIAKMYAK